MKRLFLLVALVFGTASGCDNGDALPDSVATLSPTGKIQVNVARDVQLDLSERLATQLNPDVTVGKVTGEPRVEKIGDDYFLVTNFDQADKEASCLTTAVRLDLAEGNKLGLLSAYAGKAPQGDTCSGVACSQCKLMSNNEGNFCSCLQQALPNGYCNHSTGG